MRGVGTRGAEIRRLRNQNGWTQEQLADFAECDVKTLRKAERGDGRVDVAVVGRISESLACDLMQIVSEEEATGATTDKNVAVIQRWHQAFLESDWETLISLHTDDTILEIPSSEDLPDAGCYEGIVALREHLAEIAKQ